MKLTNEVPNRLIADIVSIKPLAASAGPCTLGLVQCARSPCSVQKCYAYPSATCINDYCGGCNAIFYDQNGVELTKAQCAGGNILTVYNGGNVPIVTTSLATPSTSACIKHRKTGCTVDSDCCRSDGICLKGRCRRKRRAGSLRSAAADATFDNFDEAVTRGTAGETTKMGGMMVSVWSVGFVFIALMIVVPVMYWWYYQNFLVKKFKKAARREIFHGLEVNDHSDHEFADSEDTNEELFVE